MNLSPVGRARLMNGDWSIQEDSQISSSWFRRYKFDRGHIYPLNDAGETTGVINPGDCRRFATIDTAGTSKDKADEARGKPASWSVCGVWDYYRKRDLLFLRHIWRGRVGWNELKLRIRALLEEWHVRRVVIEKAHVGPALAEELGRYSTHLIGPVLAHMPDSTNGAKLDRAIAAGLLTRLDGGRFYLPTSADWLSTYESELTTWTGSPDETADQIDVSSYACWEAKRNAQAWGGTIRT